MTDAAIKIRDEGTTLKPEAAKWLSAYVKDHFNMTIAAKTK
jgi:hypothetical protein